MKLLNNRGFTLVELLAVIVILIIITAVAVPNISSSVERSKEKQYEENVKSIEYAVELYLSDNKNYRNSFYSGNCYIDINDDLISNKYMMKDELELNEDNSLKYQYVLYQSSKVIVTNDKLGKSKCS